MNFRAPVNFRAPHKFRGTFEVFLMKNIDEKGKKETKQDDYKSKVSHIV